MQLSSQAKQDSQSSPEFLRLAYIFLKQCNCITQTTTARNCDWNFSSVWLTLLVLSGPSLTCAQIAECQMRGKVAGIMQIFLSSCWSVFDTTTVTLYPEQCHAENYPEVYLSYKMHLATAASLYIKTVRLTFISNINSINRRKVRNSSAHTDNWTSLGTSAGPVARM